MEMGTARHVDGVTVSRKEGQKWFTVKQREGEV